MNTILKMGIAATALAGFSYFASPAQAQLTVGVTFGGRPHVAVRPLPPPRPAPVYHLGLQGREVHDGFLITSVERHSPAWQARLEPGDVIHEANGKPIACEYDFRRVAQTSNGCLDLVVHDVRTHKDKRIHVELALVRPDVPSGHQHGGPVYDRPGSNYGGRPDYGRPSYGRPDYGRPSYGPYGREL